MIFRIFSLIALLYLSSTNRLIAESIVSDNKIKEKVEDINSNESSLRVITLTSLSTDIINKISAKSLVAIPGSSLYKNKIEFNKLPRISQGRTPPDLEKIVSLKPNLVIGTRGFHDKIINKLDSLNIDTISYEVRSWDDLENLVDTINVKLKQNVNLTSQRIIKENLYSCSNEINNNNPNIVVLASTKPMLSPNSRSWAGQLLNRFNINSLTKDLDSKSEFKGYVNLSPEWLLKTDPDNLVLIETRPGQFNDFSNSKPFSSLKAVKSDKIYSFNYYGLINPGSLKSINNACEKLKEII